MADTSQRKARRTIGSGATIVEKNKEGASIAQGNETAGMIWNVIRAEGMSFDNAENFDQDEGEYFESASTVYTETEKLVQTLERKKAMHSYTATFDANEYTLNARSGNLGELVLDNVEQVFQDKTIYLAPNTIDNGFHTTFVAPSDNTDISTIKIQKYDGTYSTFTLKKYNNGSLVNLNAKDILQNHLYTLIIIEGDAVIFTQNEATPTTQGLTYLTTKVKITYDNATSLLYSVIDFESNQEITNGTINLATVGVNGLDTGSLRANTAYYVFEIKDLTNNFVKTITSSSLSNPILPTGFTVKKAVFGFVTNGSSQIYPFAIEGKYVRYLTTITQFSISPLPTTATLTPVLSIPPNTVGEFLIIWNSFSTGNARAAFLYNATESFKAVFQSGISIIGYIMDASGITRAKVDNNRKLLYYANSNTGNYTLYLNGYYLDYDI